MYRCHFFRQTKTRFSSYPHSCFSKPCLFSQCSHSYVSTSHEAPRNTSLSKEETLVYFLKRCSTLKEVDQVHAQIIKSGFEQYLFVIGRVLEFCAASDHNYMDYAVSVFENIKFRDGFLWNTMIRGFGNSKETERAFDYYKTMQREGLLADNFTFSFLIKVSGQLGSAFLGRQVHCCSLKYGLESHVFVRNNLIHFYGMLKDIAASRQLFDEIPAPDIVAWNTIIDCHVYCGLYKEALDMFFRMLDFGMKPDEATFVVTLCTCSALGALDFGRWIHSYVHNTDLGSSTKVNNALIDMYSKCGALEEAYGTFDRMSKKNNTTWNTMILGLATHGRSNEALELFSKMIKQKLGVPDGVTFLVVLCACSHGGMVDEGRRVFDAMIKDYRIQPTIKHYGCMVDLLGRAGLVEEAYRLIKGMPMQCNAIVWRTLLAACRLHGNVELGKQVRKQLQQLESDHSSDHVLLANMYASEGQWNEVIGMRKTMQRRGVQKPQPGSSFIGMCPSSQMESIEYCSEVMANNNGS